MPQWFDNGDNQSQPDDSEVQSLWKINDLIYRFLSGQASGSVIVNGGSGASSSQVQGTAADGAAAVGNPIQIAGKDGSGNIQTIATNTDGELLVNLETADIEIGAVEIKNSTDDTRATVGANGLYVDVRSTTGAGSGTVTDGSGAIGTGGVSQTVFAANASRKYFFYQNIDTSEAQYINFNGAATVDSNSLRIDPLASLTMTAGDFVSTDAITCISATIAKKFIAKQG